MKERLTTAMREEIRARLRDAGLRATPGRIAVYHFVKTSGRPVTHADAVERLGEEGFDQTTVYRNLTDLTDSGLLVRLEVDRVWRFEPSRGTATADQHAHFVCVDCGQISCLDDLAVNLRSAGRHKLPALEVTEILLRGHCGACSR